MHDTCVGVVFWFLGIRVPLWLLIIVSRIFLAPMKENKSSATLEHQVLLPLFNLLLFDKHDSPDFNSDHEVLSNNFVEAFKTDNPTEIEENFFTKRIYFYLKELSTKERENVFNILFNNDVYISTLTIGNLFSNKLSPDEKNTISTQNKILADLLNYKEEAKISKNILLYFSLQFVSIFEYKFSDSKIITKFEYYDIIDKLGSFQKLNS